MTRSEDTYADTMSKTLTKHAIGKIAEKVSGELPSGFVEEVLETISSAAYVRTVDGRMPFTETLWGYEEDFASLFQHMEDSYKALFADVG